MESQMPGQAGVSSSEQADASVQGTPTARAYVVLSPASTLSHATSTQTSFETESAGGQRQVVADEESSHLPLLSHSHHAYQAHQEHRRRKLLFLVGLAGVVGLAALVTVFVAPLTASGMSPPPGSQHNTISQESHHLHSELPSIETHEDEHATGAGQATQESNPSSSVSTEQPTVGIPSLTHDYRGRPRRVESSIGIVAADQSQCSDIGADVLKEGGSAVDAAIAACLCQGILNPFASGVGGGFFMTVRDPNGTAEFIDAREVAPAAAHKDMYKGMPSSASLFGGLAIAVPLELKGLYLAWQRWGRLPWQRLVTPSVYLAGNATSVYPYMAKETASMERYLKAGFGTAATFLIQDSITGSYRSPKVGEKCCARPVLAATLQRVAEEGPGWLYSGPAADALAQEIQGVGGIVTSRDLADAQPNVTQLVSMQAGPYVLHVPPPPSSAAILGLALRILTGNTTATTSFNSLLKEPLLGSVSGGAWMRQGNGTADQLLDQHWIVEAMKQAFVLRMNLGDPGVQDNPAVIRVDSIMQAILNATFADLLRSDLKADTVLNVTEYGRQYNPYAHDNSTGLPDDQGTTHISVVDSRGQAVGLTSTVNGPFGSFVVSNTTGILLNNEMDDFSRPDKPNGYGLEPSEANFIAPGKRPLSSMTPTIVTNATDGALVMVVGANGGPKIITATLQTIVRTLLLGWDLSDAVTAPRLHHQLLPYNVSYESFTYPDYLGNMSFVTSPQLVNYLASKGNGMTPVDSYAGNVQAILVDKERSVMIGMSDPRKDGAPAAL